VLIFTIYEIAIRLSVYDLFFQARAICEWGTERINLCQYDTESEIVEALIEKMTLQEKIGQMTQSVWHKAAPPRWMPTSQSL
jgi:hypothetical protein